MRTFDSFELINIQELLENQTGRKLHLKINNNRSTMLSVKWAPDVTKVSLHRMFLQAPKNIMDELACYLRREHRNLSPGIKAYIEQNLQKLDYSHELNPDKIQTAGEVYDLKQFYDSINDEYFDNRLNLKITWYGKKKRSSSSRVTFGLYYEPLKLIKISRLLDSPEFPPYFVAYIIYHEMLHHVIPAYVDSRGFKHIHSKEFKELEKRFTYYNQAQQWIKNNHKYFFNNCY